MSKASELLALIKDLDSWSVADTELAHSKADDILLKAIRALAQDSVILKDLSNQLIDKFEALDKWYA